MAGFSLEDLAAVVAARDASSADKSYVKSLLEAGHARAARKFGEESLELVIAALEGERKAIVGEAADVLFHLLVLLRARQVEFTEVLAELERRSGVSGHAEKASRGASAS